MMQLKNILIYATARTGSTSLMDLLLSLSGADELGKKFPGFEPFDTRLKKRDINNFTTATTYLINRYRLIKHLWNQQSPSNNQDILASRAIKRVIFLYRRTVFDQALSRRVAVINKEWGVPVQHHPIAITDDELNLQAQYFIYSTYYNLNLVKMSGRPFFIACYDDLFSENQRIRRTAIAPLFQFLEIPYRAVKPAMAFTSPLNKYKDKDYYSRTVVNLDDIKEAQGHWNDFFNDPLTRPENFMP